MAVREDKDRRVGGESEKFLTLEEAARRLGLPADDVGVMIRDGSLPSFRLAGNLLRVRSSDVELLRARKQKSGVRPASVSEPSGTSRSSLWERLIDFLYFNDFYLVAFLILLTLLAIIFAL